MNVQVLKNLETVNFRLSTDAAGVTTIKATTPLAKALLKLKKLANPIPCNCASVGDALAEIVALEEGVVKLAAI